MKVLKLIKKFENKPYLKNFKIMSKRSLSDIHKLMKVFTNWISGNDSEEYLMKYLNKTRFGSKFLYEKRQSEKFIKMIERFNQLHTTCPRNLKSRFLSLLSVAYNRSELIDLGIKTSPTQYKKSKKFIDTEFTELFEKKSRKINQDLQKTVEKYLLMNSSDSTEVDRNGNPIFYLRCPKIEIYKKRKDSENIKISLSKFYKLCSKNFKKPIKKQICVRYVKKVKA